MTRLANATSVATPLPTATSAQYAEAVYKDAPLWWGGFPAVQTNGNDDGSRTTFPDEALRPRLSPPPLRPDPYSFVAKQKWEGYVTEVGAETFWARLVPLLGEGGDQEAEIYIEEIDQADRNLIEPGAVFYWSIGYLDGPSGRLRASYIRFRRLPAWTRHELDAAKNKPSPLHDLFDAAPAA